MHLALGSRDVLIVGIGPEVENAIATGSRQMDLRECAPCLVAQPRALHVYAHAMGMLRRHLVIDNRLIGLLVRLLQRKLLAGGDPERFQLCMPAGVRGPVRSPGGNFESGYQHKARSRQQGAHHCLLTSSGENADTQSPPLSRVIHPRTRNWICPGCAFFAFQVSCTLSSALTFRLMLLSSTFWPSMQFATSATCINSERTRSNFVWE